ncbi:MAG: hypothetical protein ABIQ11_06105 [Saprospiraceae bacterium]
MKIFQLQIILCVLILGLIACGGKKDATTEQQTTTDSLLAANPAVTTSAGVPGQKHFMCPKNCEGSGGDAKGTCPVCGSEYVHNQAFHNQTPSTTPGEGTPITINSDGTTSGTTKTPGSTQPATTQTQPVAAQNAKGEWHFSCSKVGCGGGAGAAGTCPKCGGALAHNQAFHAQ